MDNHIHGAFASGYGHNVRTLGDARRGSAVRTHTLPHAPTEAVHVACSIACSGWSASQASLWQTSESQHVSLATCGARIQSKPLRSGSHSQVTEPCCHLWLCTRYSLRSCKTPGGRCSPDLCSAEAAVFATASPREDRLITLQVTGSDVQLASCAPGVPLDAGFASICATS